jgi:hypothetical protein
MCLRRCKKGSRSYSSSSSSDDDLAAVKNNDYYLILYLILCPMSFFKSDVSEGGGTVEVGGIGEG